MTQLLRCYIRMGHTGKSNCAVTPSVPLADLVFKAQSMKSLARSVVGIRSCDIILGDWLLVRLDGRIV